MRLILHIGPRKTGSTALQGFLHANLEPLAALGFYYATPWRHQHAGPVVNALCSEQKEVVQNFLEKHVETARRKRAHTLIVSSEHFYGMSVLHGTRINGASHADRPSADDVMQEDDALIRTLRGVMPDGLSAVRVVCYLRRPDLFAESLYNEQIKNGSLVTGSFDEFLRLAWPVLQYNQYLSRWTESFGRDQCVVRIYETLASDVVSDFLRAVLDIQDWPAGHAATTIANQRMSRDLLEFKRSVNKGASARERRLEWRIFALLEARLQLRESEPTYFQQFLSPERRAELLARLAGDMESLRSSFDVPPFPAFDLAGARATWKPYPGLMPARLNEIEMEYRRINRRVAFRVERAGLRLAQRLRSHAGGRELLRALRKAGVTRAILLWARRASRGEW